MRQMINNEYEDNQPAHDHVTRCECRFDMLSFDIIVRSSTSVVDGKPNGEINVQRDGNQKDHPHQPKQRAKIAQMLGVIIDPAGPEKYLEVADQMTDYEQQQNQPSNRD